MSVATVITEGFGSFGDIAHIITDGYDVSGVAPPTPTPPPTPDTPTGGKGDNERRRRNTIKPTGLVDRKPEGRRGVQERLRETQEIAEEIARGVVEVPQPTVEAPVLRISLLELDAEIGRLLRKQMRSEEDEILLLLLMAAVSA